MPLNIYNTHLEVADRDLGKTAQSGRVSPALAHQHPIPVHIAPGQSPLLLLLTVMVEEQSIPSFNVRSHTHIAQMKVGKQEREEKGEGEGKRKVGDMGEKSENQHTGPSTRETSSDHHLRERKGICVRRFCC